MHEIEYLPVPRPKPGSKAPPTAPFALGKPPAEVRKGHMARDVTQLLIDWNNGDRQALDRLMPMVYDELHRQAERYMRRERREHTLQPTALVNEAFLQLIDQTRVRWQSRTHFFGVAAQLMRRVMMLHARSQRAAKRGANVPRVPFEDTFMITDDRAADLVELDDALGALEAFDPRLARIVELKFFGGLTVEEMAEVLDLSTATVKREWRTARAWLLSEVGETGAGSSASDQKRKSR